MNASQKQQQQKHQRITIFTVYINNKSWRDELSMSYFNCFMDNMKLLSQLMMLTEGILESAQ